MKVLLKILKKNVRNSIVCFMSTILAAIILFVFLGVYSSGGDQEGVFDSVGV